MEIDYKASLIASLAAKVQSENADCISDFGYVDIDRILKKEGIFVVETDLPKEVIYYTYCKDDENDGHVVIVLNEALTMENKRLSVATAYGHFLYNYTKGEPYEYTFTTEDIDESADPFEGTSLDSFLSTDTLFALFLLVPRDALVYWDTESKLIFHLDLAMRISVGARMFVVSEWVVQALYILFQLSTAEAIMKSQLESDDKYRDCLQEALDGTLDLPNVEESEKQGYRNYIVDILEEYLGIGDDEEED